MNNIKIALASDHGGFELKNKICSYLSKKGFSVEDLGTNSFESCDYPVFAKRVVDRVLADKNTKGILVCPNYSLGSVFLSEDPGNKCHYSAGVYPAYTYNSVNTIINNNTGLLDISGEDNELGIAGAPENKVQRPGSTIVLSDGDGGWFLGFSSSYSYTVKRIAKRHSGRSNNLMADGHVESIKSISANRDLLYLKKN